MDTTQLTIADMASLRSLIEAAVTRGAFKAPELSTVGAVYDKLSRFIEETTAKLAEERVKGESNA